MKRHAILSAILLVLSIGAAFAAARVQPIPPLPATLDKATAMLEDLSDPVLKATLAKPGLRGRVEALLGIGGCDWTVNANLSRQARTGQAAKYLDDLEDDELMAALTANGMLDRINTIFDANNCVAYEQQPTGPQGFPEPPNNANQDAGPYPYGYPYGYRGNGRIPNGRIPNGRRLPIPGTPYGGYGGVAP